ncbi:unnamed protein product [Phaedon cochleariae]|uniref:Latrophilin Cirl n=1 Tax=Phaedon cochleariae TaxID=80249 RepID=A0A9P0GQV3_PHACE|nr:unnamed protein product [Phaedon cochleariae]
MYEKGDSAMAWHEKFRCGLLLLLLSFVVISEATTKALGNQGTPKSPKHVPAEKEETHKEIRYETAYACEGKVLKIECRDGELIKLIRANYGRFSITICNDHGNTDWSVNCMSPKSLRVLHSRCTHNQNCSIPASTSMFGDPCVGTHKYLEAHYQCIPATTTTTTSRPSPPWLITSQPPAWSTAQPAPPAPARPSPATGGARPAPASPSTTTAAPSRPTEAAREAARQPFDAARPPFDMYDEEAGGRGEEGGTTEGQDEKQAGPLKDTSDDLPSPTPPPASRSDPPAGAPPPPRCEARGARTVRWPPTRAGATAIEPCPGGTTGFAKWHCRAGAEADLGRAAHWWPSEPDLSECRSVWLTSLEQRIVAGRDPLVSITNDLAQVTGSKTLYGGDMMITTKIIQKMTEKMSKDIRTVDDARQREQIVTEMLMDVAKTGSNLLDASQRASWKDLSYKEQMSVATSLLIGLEENAFLLADTVNSEKTVEKVFKNILLSVRVLDLKSLKSETFPSEDHKRGWQVSNDTVELPRGALMENSDGALVRLVFVAFDRLEEILQWQPEGGDNNASKILNSKVISASLGKGRHIQLREPVKLTMRHLRTENVSNPACVFWDYTANAWSEEGCRVALSNSTHTVCYCDHLTNFAILMDVHAVYLPMSHEIALQIITYVGCVVSIVCLVLAIITFQLFRGLKSDRTTIHCNLCVCLLIAEVIFLLGIGQTDNAILCGVVAGFLHYFFLSAFIWMFFEGFQLYVMLIEVFEAEKSRIRWYYFFAYGLPFLVVFISATIYPQGYGTQRHCWLQTDNYFIYSFVGPVFVVIVLNVIFLIMAIFMMCRHSSNSISLKNKEHSRLASTSGKEENALQIKFQAHLAWLKGAFILVFLLGLTWTFGFLYLNKESVVMAYLFATLNSLQGFFIFLFHCIQNEKVRKEYRKFIRRNSWLPQCLHCSSASAGSGSSSSGAKERRTSIFGNQSQSGGGTNSLSTDNSVLAAHGTSLQREWNSRSCTSVNRACKTPVPTSTSANMAATLSRMIKTAPPNPTPDPEPNTCTLPHIRNFSKVSSNNLNIPKSISTWGPLHKPFYLKNISFKSCSRDSGHGGSEQEDSPRSHTVAIDPGYNLTLNSKDPLCHQMIQHDPTKKSEQSRPTPWGNHTYTEIFRGEFSEDPVYEEIDHNEIQISDMSRQSSRSYGDHRPLIPYSPGNESCADTYRRRNGNASARSLAAVLDGKTVVCHLEPAEMYPSDCYLSRTLAPAYGDS